LDDPALAHPLELAPLQAIRGIEVDGPVRPNGVVAEEVVLDLSSRPRDGSGCSSGHSLDSSTPV
jgi:hypothetical protein